MEKIVKQADFYRCSAPAQFPLGARNPKHPRSRCLCFKRRLFLPLEAIDVLITSVWCSSVVLQHPC